MKTEIETYLNSLSEDILSLNVSCRSIKSLPNLTRFKNLQKLYCLNNELTSLPILPQNLQELYCNNNKLTSLPILPQNLRILFCFNNELTWLPTLPENLKILSYSNIPIYKIVNSNSLINYRNSLIEIKKNVQILNNFRHLYYCLKFKKQLRKWLWEIVREPIIKKIYTPNYLVENLGDEDDLDTVLNNWTFHFVVNVITCEKGVKNNNKDLYLNTKN
jgi:Leucine-rich repeat (LRR) protein